MMGEIPLDQILSLTGGGFSGVAGVFLWLFITGKLPSPAERSVQAAEIDKRDKLLAEKDAYIKELVTDMNDLNDAVRRETLPALQSVMQLLLRREGGHAENP